jgi:hypothetical protein
MRGDGGGADFAPIQQVEGCRAALPSIHFPRLTIPFALPKMTPEGILTHYALNPYGPHRISDAQIFLENCREACNTDQQTSPVSGFLVNP